ncbi:MAG: ImmA/IrrE family metallo-endopeptidase [Phycisphaerales bacterium]
MAAIMSQRGVTTHEVAQAMHIETQLLDDLIHGRTRLTADLALQLEHTLGATTQFWLRREKTYQTAIAHLVDNLDGREVDAWLKAIPAADMQSLRWIPACDTKSMLAYECLRFFGVSSVKAWHDEYADLEKSLSGQFHTSETFASEREAVLAWLREAERASGHLECSVWDPARWRELLPSLRTLTREPDPKVFIPQLQTQCAAAGVAVVVVRAPRGCRASGAALHQARNRRLIALSSRHLVDDHMWFTFFHEAAHLLLHPATPAIIDSDDELSEQFEQEASEAASNLLVPPAYQATMRQLRRNRWAVARFAKSIGVAPGIVVGQLQHIGVYGREQMNHLKRRYRWNGSILERA